MVLPVVGGRHDDLRLDRRRPPPLRWQAGPGGRPGGAPRLERGGPGEAAHPDGPRGGFFEALGRGVLARLEVAVDAPPLHARPVVAERLRRRDDF